MIHNQINDLDMQVRPRFHRALEEMKRDELLKLLGAESVAISETKRDLTVQMAYFTRGRMEPKYVKQFYAAAGLYAIGEAEAKIICTNTLRSNHMSGRAADFVPVKDGKYWWNAPREVWERMGEIGEKNGLQWGGRWKDLEDCPHFEC